MLELVLSLIFDQLTTWLSVRLVKRMLSVEVTENGKK